MIPRAYFFVDEKLDRYENYSSTLCEYFSRAEIVELDEEVHKTTRAADYIAECHFDCEFEYIFVVYNPNKSKMDLSKYGESNNLKMLVDTKDKEIEFERYCETLQDLSALVVQSSEISELDIKSLFLNKSYNYDNAVEKCNTAIQEHIDSLIELIGLCVADFRKEFVF